MNILHINSYYSTSYFYKNFTDLLNNKRYNSNVHIPVSYSFRESDFNYGNYSKLSKCYKQHDRYIFHLKHYKILKDVKNRYDMGKFDIIHAHSLFSNGYIAYRLNQMYDIPYIVAIRNTDVNIFFKKMIHLRPLGNKLLKNAKNIIFISESYKNQVLDYYVKRHLVESVKEKSVVIPNGIEQFWFDNLNNPKENPKDVIRLLQVGDINKNKNIVTTLKAVDVLNKKGIKCTLTAIGNIKNRIVFDQIKDNKYLTYI